MKITADTITPSQVEDYLATLETAVATIRRLKADIESSSVPPEDAAAIVNETAQYLANFTLQ